jgi:hypothetical protein
MSNVQYPMTKDADKAAPVCGTSVRPANRFLCHWSFLASLVIGHCVIGTSSSSAEPAALGSTTASRFGNLPLYFEANRGQTDAEVGFFARGRDHTVYLRGDGATIALSQGSAATNASPLVHSRATNRSNVRFVRMTLEGAKPGAASSGLEQLAGRVNYLIGNNPSQWQRGVPTFAKVQYDGIYDGVDLVYYGNNQELEYDFLLAPNADPSAIVMLFDGADQLRIDDRGDLVLRVGSGELRQRKPVAYQTIDGKRRIVPASYKLSGSHTVSFALGRYDSSKALVIDPILSYSTYLGGSKNDIGWAIAVDSEGRAYVAGDTLSVFTKLPTSGEQTNSSGGTKYGGDAFVARFDFDTNQSLTLGYLTYFGGSGLDAALGIAVDAAGAAYLTGYTTSTNFPVLPDLGVFQTNISGAIVLSYAKYRDPKGDRIEEIVGSFNSHYPDAFVTKLDTNGLGVYSTYLGGELTESGVDIAVDSTGAAYVVGYTESCLTFLVSNRVEIVRCTNGICGAAVVTTNLVSPRWLTAVSVVTNDLGFLKVGAFLTTNTLQSVVTTTLLSPIDSVPYYAGFPIANAIQTNNASLRVFDIVATTAKDKRFVQPGTNPTSSSPSSHLTPPRWCTPPIWVARSRTSASESASLQMVASPSRATRTHHSSLSPTPSNPNCSAPATPWWPGSIPLAMRWCSQLISAAALVTPATVSRWTPQVRPTSPVRPAHLIFPARPARSTAAASSPARTPRRPGRFPAAGSATRSSRRSSRTRSMPAHSTAARRAASSRARTAA